MDAETPARTGHPSDQQYCRYHQLCDGRVRSANACLWYGYDRRAWDPGSPCQCRWDFRDFGRTGKKCRWKCTDDLWRQESHWHCRYHGWWKFHDHRQCFDHVIWGSMLWRNQYPSFFQACGTAYRRIRQVWKGTGSKQCHGCYGSCLPVGRRIGRRSGRWRCHRYLYQEDGRQTFAVWTG